MTDQLNESLELAFLQSLTNFAEGYDPILPVSEPNSDFTPPAAETEDENTGKVVYGRYLRFSFLPSEPSIIGIPHDSWNEYPGIIQIDVLYAQQAGELAVGRIASDLLAYYKRGTSVENNGYQATIYAPGFRAPLMITEPWVMIPVRFRYRCFALTPA